MATRARSGTMGTTPTRTRKRRRDGGSPRGSITSPCRQLETPRRRRRNQRADRPALLSWKTGDVVAHPVQRLAGGDVQRLHVRPAERRVGDEVLRDRNELQQLSLRRDHVDAALRVQGFGRTAGTVEAGS